MSWNLAQEKGYVMVQDTAWDGYEQIPAWIMQGYLTLAAEILEQMDAAAIRPTHCFLQAGVGSFAAAVAGFLVAALGEKAPGSLWWNRMPPIAFTAPRWRATARPMP